MKFIHLTFYCCLTLFMQAQKKALPAFGQVDKALLQLKECSFDKMAGAMIVFDEAESYFDVNLYSAQVPVVQQTVYRSRIKIFNKKEFERANINIRYQNDPLVNVKKLNAQTYNLDAGGNVVITKLDPASVYKKQINKRIVEKIFAFPDVKEGSVLEYEYTLEGQTAGHWFFQKTIPVEYSRFIVNFPKELTVKVNPNCSLPLQSGNNSLGNASDKWYSMEKIPAFAEEPFMSTPLDYLQQLDFDLVGFSIPGGSYINLGNSWIGMVKFLVEDEDFGRQLKKDIPRTAELEKMLEGVTNEMQKMRIIHQYVRTNMKWNERENIWALDGVKKAWKDKIGTSGEINLILINLLKDAKLDVKPILVSTRDNGLINSNDPDIAQFNKVMAFVEINKNFFILDATESETPSHMIPFDVMASEGLVIDKLDKFEWGWKVIWDDKSKFSRAVYLDATIAGEGKIKGAANIIANGYNRISDLRLMKKGKERLMGYFMDESGLQIDSFNIQNVDNDTLPLVETFNFSLPVNSAGGYNYFTINHFTDLKKNPFILEERKTEIFYGARQDYSIFAQVAIPKGFVMDELPQNVKMVTEDKSIVFQRFSEVADDNLSIQISLKINNPVYATDVYSDIKEFFKKTYELLNEKFVYKKK